jgi:phage terminase large subunit
MTSGNEVRLQEIVGKGYADFWRFRGRYRVVKGSRASKKSTTTSLWYIVHLMKYSQANLLVIRKNYNTHKDSTYAQLKWAIWRLGVGDRWKCTINPLEITYIPTGQKILFRGLDDPISITSITVDRGHLCWVWFEEFFQVDNEEDFDKIDLSIRGEIPAPLFKQITGTFNPWFATHWSKKRFFDVSRDPNIMAKTTTWECNEFLDDADRQVFLDMKENNPERYKVEGEGDWGAPGGQYYPEWRESIHVVQPFEVPPWWKGFRSMDYGLDCLSMHWWRIDQQGKVYLTREIWQPGLHLSDAVEMIYESEPPAERDIYSYTSASPDLWNRQQVKSPQGISGYEIMMNTANVLHFNLGLIKADDRRIPGWRALREYIAPYEDEYGNQTAMLQVFNHCTHIISDLPALLHDEHKPEDAATEPHEITHAPDDVRYGIMSRPPARSIRPADNQHYYRRDEPEEGIQPRSKVTGY